MKFNFKNVFLLVGIFVFTFAMFGLSTHKAEAATRTAVESGIFGSTATWGGESVPTATDTIVINSGVVVTTDAGLTHEGPMTNNGTLQISGGDFTVTAPGAITNNGTITLTGSLVGDGSLTNAQDTSRLNIGGSATITTLTATAAGNIVTYTGATPTCKATTYYSLNFTGSGAVTCAATAVTNLATSGTVTWTQTANMAVAGTLTVGAGTTITTGAFTYGVTGITTVNGSLVLTANNSKTFTGLVTVSSTGSLTGASTGIITSAGIANSGTVNITGTVTVGTAGATFSGTNAIANLTISTGTTTNAGTLTLSGTLTVNGAMTNSGTLTTAAVAASSSTLTNSGTATITTFSGTLVGLVNTGTLILSGATTAAADITTLTATATSNTITYDRAGTQTVKATTYNDLTLDGSGEKTFGSAVTVNHTLNVDDNVSLNLTGNSTTKYLRFDGTLKKSGSWGFTGAGATHTETVYITAGAGKVTASEGVKGGQVSSTTVTNEVTTTPTITEVVVTTTPATPTTPAVVEGCTAGNKFSTVTGKPCASITNPGVGHAYTFGNTVVKMGSKGEACKAWQNFLNDKAQAKLVTDGWCGKLTITAAKNWQKANGLKVDGLLGAASRAKALLQ